VATPMTVVVSSGTTLRHPGYREHDGGATVAG